MKLKKAGIRFCSKATSNLPKIATFRNWLLAEAATDARHLKAMRR